MTLTLNKSKKRKFFICKNNNYKDAGVGNLDNNNNNTSINNRIEVNKVSAGNSQDAGNTYNNNIKENNKNISSINKIGIGNSQNMDSINSTSTCNYSQDVSGTAGNKANINNYYFCKKNIYIY